MEQIFIENNISLTQEQIDYYTRVGNETKTDISTAIRAALVYHMVMFPENKKYV